MSRPRFLLVFGGRSSEHDISIRSATEVLAALQSSGAFEVSLLGIGRDGAWHTGDVNTPLAEIIRTGPVTTDTAILNADVVFPLLHGPHGEDGSFQGLLEVIGVAYIGSGVFASALCMDKFRCKELLNSPGYNIPVVPWTTVYARDLVEMKQRQLQLDSIESQLPYPLFVKPASQGSSIGISRVTDRSELNQALFEAARFDHTIVVEREIVGREIELAVLGDGSADTVCSVPGEIKLPPGQWYDFESKYQNSSVELNIPATLDHSVVRNLTDSTLAAFKACGCHGLARVDFLVEDHTGIAYINEINTVPGFTTISMYPKLMENSGVAYSQLIERLATLAIKRAKANHSLCDANASAGRT